MQEVSILEIRQSAIEEELKRKVAECINLDAQIFDRRNQLKVLSGQVRPFEIRKNNLVETPSNLRKGRI
jgi:DNA repair exonuclease SbcCD ATPase subunit